VTAAVAALFPSEASETIDAAFRVVADSNQQLLLKNFRNQQQYCTVAAVVSSTVLLLGWIMIIISHRFSRTNVAKYDRFSRSLSFAKN
jgi:hypothetical protein